MQIVGGTDRHVVYFFCALATAQLVDVTVEPLELSEKTGLGKMTVNDSHRVVRVERRYELITGGLDGLHVPGCDISGRTYKGEIFHGFSYIRLILDVFGWANLHRSAELMLSSTDGIDCYEFGYSHAFKY